MNLNYEPNVEKKDWNQKGVNPVTVFVTQTVWPAFAVAMLVQSIWVVSSCFGFLNDVPSKIKLIDTKIVDISRWLIKNNLVIIYFTESNHYSFYRSDINKT